MSEKFAPENPKNAAELAAYFRKRADGHAPDFDISVYARPHIWGAVADALASRSTDSDELAERFDMLQDTLRRLAEHKPGTPGLHYPNIEALLVSAASHAEMAITEIDGILKQMRGHEQTKEG